MKINMQVGMLHICEKPCFDTEVRQKATRKWAIYMSWIQNTNIVLSWFCQVVESGSL